MCARDASVFLSLYELDHFAKVSVCAFVYTYNIYIGLGVGCVLLNMRECIKRVYVHSLPVLGFFAHAPLYV